VIRPTFRQALVARTLALLRVIWGALLAMVLIDVAIGVWLALRLGRLFPSDIAATLIPALYAMAVAVALLTLWWRRLLTADRCVAAAGSAAPPPGLNAAPETDSERRAVGALARFQRASLVVWILCEAIAVFGLVMSLGAGDPRHVTGLGAASFILLLMQAPSPQRVEAIVDAVPSR
jgi:hypothetical protein